MFELPDDYFDSYQQRIMAVSEADVQRVAARYVDPDKGAIVIVGRSSEIRAPLGQLGVPVSVVDVDGVPVSE
ncbi:MAG TPA: hypothetical protein VMS56_15505 [Thermoanaerobaculia bacterium]|nr:hypothetical protein [Thermoanaerobaculia bacterium]